MYFTMAFAMLQMSNFLLDYARSLGYSLSVVGIVMSLLTIGSTFGGIALGVLSDKLNKVKFVIQLALAISGLAAVALLVFGSTAFVLMPAVFIIGFFLSSLYAIFDTWVLNDSEKSRDTYSTTLVFSSLGRCLAALLLGWLFIQFGYQIFAVSLLIFICIILAAVSLLPERRIAQQAKPLTINGVKELFTIKAFRNTVIFCSFAYVGMNATVMYSTMLVRNLGGTSFDIGLFSMVLGISEMVVLVVLQKLSTRVKPVYFIMAMCASVAINSLILLFAGSYILVIAAGFFGAITSTTLLVGNKYLINNALPDEIKMTGHAIGGSIIYSLTGTLNSTAAGFMADNIGIGGGLMVYIALMLVLLVSLFGYSRKLA